MNNYKTLSSPKLIKRHTRAIIDRIGVCSDIKNNYPEDYKYFTNFLFKRHTKYPDKFNGMVNIAIQKNIKFGQLEVYIARNDGTTEVVSVMRNCAYGKARDELLQAMRSAIHPQITKFRRENESVCVLCKSSKKITIDHYEPQFIVLKSFFLKTQKEYECPKTFTDPPHHAKRFNKEDALFEKSWADFHKKYAKLRVLCFSCNQLQK